LAVVKDEKCQWKKEHRVESVKITISVFFKDLTDAQILSGKYAQSERDLTIALEKRKEVEKTELNVKTKRSIDINEEIDFCNKKLSNNKTKRSNELSNRPMLSDQYAESIQKPWKRRTKLSKQGRWGNIIASY
jgi:alpha-D-ribose 1-methylphosphonate 5-triphosphate synthase subunit PhnI